MADVTTQMQNDWQQRYRASVAESLAGPAISRAQLRVLARVVAVYLILWGSIGVWTLTAEWGARESIARGEGVAGSFVAARYDSGPGIRGFFVEQWFGEFTSADGTTTQKAWLSDRLSASTRSGDAVAVIWMPDAPGRVYLPGVSSFERLRSDLARKALTAIVVVSLFAGIPLAWRWWRRRAFRSAPPEPISS